MKQPPNESFNDSRSDVSLSAHSRAIVLTVLWPAESGALLRRGYPLLQACLDFSGNGRHDLLHAILRLLSDWLLTPS